jgi:D-psicose/D-tagatose/L-ribulose 3-epimerase
MRYGVSAWAWSYPFDPVRDPDLIERAADLGATHFEIGGDALERRAELPLDDIRSRLAARDMTSSVCGIFGPTLDVSHADPDVRAAGSRHLRECIELAAAIGARTVVGAVCGTGGGKVVSADERSSRLEWAADELRAAGAYAAQHDVLVGIEPLNRYENNFLNIQAQARPLVDAVDNPNIGLHVDLFHANIEEADLGDAIRLAGDRLVHCHAVDNSRGAPGSGHIDWGVVSNALRDIGYDKALVIETFDSKNSAIAELGAIWRPLADSQDDLVRSGIAFLKNHVGRAISDAPTTLPR